MGSFADSDKFFDNKSDRRNRKRVESAVKKARDQKREIQEALKDYS